MSLFNRVICVLFIVMIGNVYAEEWKTYTSPTCNFTIAYPVDWQIIEQANAIAIVSPQENSQDNFSENVTITVDKSDAKFYSLDKYVELGLQDLKNEPFFRLEEKGEIIISGKRAIFFISTGVGQGKGKSKQYVLSDNLTKYIITYTASKNKYDKFLKQAEQIMNSIKISGKL